eukprot:10450997-Ditylum_brightwellii.AAC.2
MTEQVSYNKQPMSQCIAQFNSALENDHDQLVNVLTEDRCDADTLCFVAKLLDGYIQDCALPSAPHNKLSNENDKNIAPRNLM